MKAKLSLLLDTHIFLWGLSADKRLTEKEMEELSREENELYISPLSLTEIIIKKQQGKLRFDGDIESAIKKTHCKLLPLTLSHVLVMEGLPLHHKDPFDRLLIAQGISENLTIMTHDKLFKKYPVTLFQR